MGLEITPLFVDVPPQVYTGVPTFTAGTPPSGTQNFSYQMTQLGSLVFMRLSLLYGTPGATVTIINAPFIAAWPTPAFPLGFATGDYTYAINGLASTASNGSPVVTRCVLRMNATPVITWIATSGALTSFYATIMYWRS